jgi:transposase
MIQLTAHMRIMVAVSPVDFRKGIDGLAAVCRQVLHSDPFSGTVFVFINKASYVASLIML